MPGVGVGCVLLSWIQTLCAGKGSGTEKENPCLEDYSNRIIEMFPP